MTSYRISPCIMRGFFLASHVTKRHLVLYIDVEFNTIFFSSLAVSSLAVKHICKRRPVSVFGKQAYTARTTVRLPFQLVECHYCISSTMYISGLATIVIMHPVSTIHYTQSWQYWVKVRTVSSKLAQQL